MEVTLHQLRLLTLVRTHGTISGAANAMHCTPSAASQQLTSLETAVGTTMLSRVGRGVQLTDAGQAMVRHAEAMLRQLEAARAEMEQIRCDVVGKIHIGVLESLTSAILPQLLAVVRDRYPGLEICTYQVENAAVQRVLAGELDGAFVVDYPETPNRRDEALIRHPVCRDWFKVIVPTDDKLVGPKTELQQLDGRSMISSSAHLSCGCCIAAACRLAGFEPNIVHQIDNYPSVLNLVAAGAGVALIPDLGLLNLPAGVRVVDLVRPFCRHVAFISRQTSESRPSIQAFRTVLDEVADRAGLDR